MSEEELAQLLTVVNSPQRTDAQQQAEARLQELEIQPGYHYYLQSIFLDSTLPFTERWLAVICFKNGVERHWRLLRMHAIGKDEKAQIRNRLLGLLGDSNNQLSIQYAQLVSRIARFDFPSEWPSLFDDLVNNLQDAVFISQNPIVAKNALIMMSQVIKSVSMVRIGRARHALQSKAPVILPVLIKLYHKYFHMWSANIELSLMEICYLCLKNLRRLIPEGFEQPHKNHDLCEFLHVSVTHLQMFVAEHEKYSSDLLERYVKSYSKLYISMINLNPTSFILVPCSHDIISTFLTLLDTRAEQIYNSSEENDFWETLAIKGLLILKKMVGYVYKQGAVTLKQRNDKEEVNNAIARLKSNLFTSSVILNLCDLIINWYLRLKPADMESWLLEPEEWVNEELNTSWEYQVRPCAENFYQDLIKYFRNDLTEFILYKISNGLADNASVSNILTKDSILCTFQLSADSIANSVDFDQLLAQVFIPEALKEDLVENKILKRRICLIIATWVPVNCSRESRVQIYKLLLSFLQSSNTKVNDKVVKLTAVQTLRIVVNDWDFNKHDFSSFLGDFVTVLIAFLADMQFTESKLYIIDTLTTLVEKCNPLMDQQVLMSILDIVPKFWERSNAVPEESILQTSLLRMLNQLVIALNANSPETHFITLPLIKECCTQTSAHYALLSEDGFDLWLSVLQHYPLNQELSKELASYCELLQPALLDSTEILPTILAIIRSYALLMPKVFETEFGAQVFSVIAGYLLGMRDDAFEVFITIADILFLSEAENEAFVTNLMNSGLLSAMYAYVMDDEHSIVLSNRILLVLARFPSLSAEVFLKMLDHLSLDATSFIDRWLTYYKNNGNPRSKKTNLLALIALASYCVPKNLHDMPQKLPDLLRKALIFAEEVNEDNDGFCQAYEGDYVYTDVDNYNYLDPSIMPNGEKNRYLALLSSRDPVLKINVNTLIRETVTKMSQELSQQDFQTLMSLTDEYTREKLQS